MSEANKGFFIYVSPIGSQRVRPQEDEQSSRPDNRKRLSESRQPFLLLLLRQNNPVISAQVHQAKQV